MSRRSIGLALALVAIAALAIPAAASASKWTLDSAGTELLPAGTSFFAQGGTDQVGVENAIVFEGEVGNIYCEIFRVEGKAWTNNGLKVLVEDAGGTATGCTLEGEPFTVNDVEFGFSSTTSGEGTVQIGLGMTFYGGSLVCHWSGSGGFYYIPGTSLLRIRGAQLAANPSVCGAAGFRGGLRLEEISGSPIYAF
jgi:hypothetical protein